MMRRFLDLTLALTLLILLSPLLFVVAFLIKIDSRGPVLYTPQMIGKDGKPFRLVRFRTLHINARNAGTQPDWTRVGRLLRDLSFDHLPMLLNLLRGELTLIGPRPMEPNIVDLKAVVWQKYVQEKPGILNIAVLKLGRAWALTRKSHPMLNQELEIEYSKERTFLSDLELFWKSILAYILSRGNIKARGKPDRTMQQRLNRH